MMRFAIRVLRFLHPAAEQERMQLRHETARNQATAMDLTRTLCRCHEQQPIELPIERRRWKR